MGCASLEPRPPLPPLAGRPAPASAAESVPEALPAFEVPVLEITRLSKEDEAEVVLAAVPEALYATVSVSFPKPSRPETQRLSALIVKLYYEHLIGLLRRGSVGFWREYGSEYRVGVVTLPDRLAEDLERLGRALEDRKGAFEDYKEVKARYLQDLVRGSGRSVAKARNLVRIGRFGPKHRWSEGPATRVETLARVKRKKVIGAWSEVLDLGRATVVVAAAPSALAELGDVRSRLPIQEKVGRRAPASPIVVPPPRDEGKHRFHALWYRAEQVQLLGYHVGPAPTHPDFRVFELLSILLDGGFRGEGNRSLRHDLGASYGVGSILWPSKDLSELFWGGYVDPYQGLRLIETHLNQVRRLRRGDFEAKALELAKAVWRGRRARALDDTEQIAQRLAGCAARGVAPSYEECLYPRLDAISAADVTRVAQTYLRETHLEWSLVGSLEYLYNRLQFEGELLIYKMQGS